MLRYLGRRVPGHGKLHGRLTAAAVTTDLAGRVGGARVKHRVNTNRIKMYDKHGSVLRVETVLGGATDQPAAA